MNFKMKNLFNAFIISCLFIGSEAMVQNPKFHIYLCLGQSNNVNIIAVIGSKKQPVINSFF